MHGAFCFACSNRSRTRLAPTPTNISTNSDAEMLKNGTPASPATARASSVLPVPGGPTSSTPLGECAPRERNFSGMLEELHDFGELFLRFVDSRHVVKSYGYLGARKQPCMALTEDHGVGSGPPAGAEHDPDEEAEERGSVRA